MATNANNDPIEISTSPAINKTANPIDAIKNWDIIVKKLL